MASDTFILAVSFDTNHNEVSCSAPDCPKYGWTTITIGWESENEPDMMARVCLKHMSQILSDFNEMALPKIIEVFKKYDKEEWGTT